MLIRRGHCGGDALSGGGGTGSGGGAPIGPVRVAFIDWDWAGRDGEARYALGLNARIASPEGATGGAPITRAHDVDLLSRRP
jgi:hypothetical protein